MAYIKHIAIRGNSHLTNSIEYVENMEKTNTDLITGINCDPYNLNDDFNFCKNLHNKVNTKIIAHHYIQSFKPGEVNDKTANEIGVKFINELAPGYQACVVTHNDKGHIHNHIIINSVNMYTGLMYKANKESYYNAREISNNFSREYGLSVINPSKYSKGIDQATYRLAMKGESWKVKMLNSIDEAIAFSSNKNEFISYLSNEGYSVKWQNKNISLKDPSEQEKYIRVDRLAEQFGDEYSMNSIIKRLNIQNEKEIKIYDERENRGIEAKKSNSNTDNIESNTRSKYGINEKNRESRDNDFKFKNRNEEDERETNKRRRNIEKDRYEVWYANQESEIKRSVNLEHIDNYIYKVGSVLRTADKHNKNNKDETKENTLKVFVAIALIILKVRKQQKLKKAEKIRSKVLATRNNVRIGNTSYNSLKASPGDNKFMKLNVSELEKLRNGANFNYTGFIKDNKITVMVKESDLDKLLDLVGRKFEKQYGNTTYKYIKQHSEKVEFRLVSENIIEKLKEENIKFACFKKGEKYNVAFSNKDVEVYRKVINKLKDKER